MAEGVMVCVPHTYSEVSRVLGLSRKTLTSTSVCYSEETVPKCTRRLLLV